MHLLDLLDRRALGIALVIAALAIVVAASVASVLPVEPDGGIGGEIVLPVEPDGGIGGEIVLPVEPDGGIGN